MDNGVLLSSEKELPDLEMAFSSPDIPWEHFSSEELVDIIDELLIHIFTWLRHGYRTTDTIFTCVYMHDYNRLQHIYLKTCIAILGALCYQIHRSIIQGKVAFEEDYVMYVQDQEFKNFEDLDVESLILELENSDYWIDLGDESLNSRYQIIKVIHEIV
jgi:hypothetical protein